MNIKLEKPGRLKIVLANTDMQKLDITFDQLDYNSPKTRKALWSILNETGAASNFIVSGSKLLIEVFPAPGNGCVIYFTLLEREEETPKRLRMKKQDLQPTVFEFANTEDMLTAVDQLFKQARSRYDKSFLYRFGEKYRLVIYLRQNQMESTLALLGEYGKKVGNSTAEIAYTQEHGQILAEYNAVEKVGRFLA